MMDYRGKKVGVLGLARSGMAAAKLLVKAGAKVYVSDAAENEKLRARAKELKKIGVEVELGGHNGRMKDHFDEIVLSPGVPIDIPILLWYKSNRPNLPIISEVEMSYRFARGMIIGITGSNGKSTTVSMVGEIFKSAGYETYIVGNIGRPMSEVVLEASENSILCVELSSFQLEMIDTFRAKVACLLNLTPDHLDRHYNVDAYYAAKTRIFENQQPEDYAVLNLSDIAVRAIGQDVQSKRLWFTTSPHSGQGVYVDRGMIIYRALDGEEKEVMPSNKISVPGRHNLANACAAIACAMPFGIKSREISDALSNFKGLPHRLQDVGVLDGVRFINDSKATNVDSLECALNSFDEPVVLIAGGYDKGADFSALKGLVKEKTRHVVLIGDTADSIRKAWNGSVTIQRAEELEEAVEKAYEAATPGGIVLLAPGCASYDMFENFEKRGEIFTEIVKELIKKK